MNGKNLISFSKISILRHNIFISFLRRLKYWNFNIVSSFGLRFLKVKNIIFWTFLFEFSENSEKSEYSNLFENSENSDYFNMCELSESSARRPPAKPEFSEYSDNGNFFQNFQFLPAPPFFPKTGSAFQLFQTLLILNFANFLTTLSLQKSCQLNCQNYLTIWIPHFVNNLATIFFQFLPSQYALC